MQYPDSYKEANSSKLCASLENSYGTILHDSKPNAQLDTVEREHFPPAPSCVLLDIFHAVTSKRWTPLCAALSFYSSRKQAQ